MFGSLDTANSLKNLISHHRDAASGVYARYLRLGVIGVINVDLKIFKVLLVHPTKHLSDFCVLYLRAYHLRLGHDAWLCLLVRMSAPSSLTRR